MKSADAKPGVDASHNGRAWRQVLYLELHLLEVDVAIVVRRRSDDSFRITGLHELNFDGHI